MKRTGAPAYSQRRVRGGAWAGSMAADRVCYLDGDMRGRRWLLPVAIAVLVPAILGGWTLTAVFAEQAPSPSASQSALPGDPTKGATAFGSAGCTACHGANLEGGIGAKLNPIQKFPGVPDPLDPIYLSTTIRNGRSGDSGFSAQMPAFATDKLSDTDLSNIMAFIIQQNRSGPAGLDPVTLARSDVFWVTIGIVLMVMLTWLLARYNMRWIARRAAARRESGRIT
jgi:mono/diheme cytochrome c family protein